jgi:hypothetical protein
MPKLRSHGMSHSATKQDQDLTDAQIMALVELHSVACFDSSGCVVLKNGTWLQPEQWQVHLDRMIKDCETGDENDGH